MTITAYPVRNEYTGLTGQSVFDYTFKIYADDELKVYLTTDVPAEDCPGDLTVAYTVSGVGDEDGGSITLNTPLTETTYITIVGNVEFERTTNYENNGDFVPETVNEDFDRIVSMVKQVQDQANRAVLLLDCQQGTKPLSMPWPEAGQALRWKDDETGLENVDLIFADPDVLIPIILDLTGCLVDGTDVIVGKSDTLQIFFKTNDTERWYIDASGNFLPYVTNTHNIGSASLCIDNIYLGDAGNLYLGDSQQSYIRNSGDLLYITNTANNIYIISQAAYAIFFATNNINRWVVNSSGHLTPGAANTYNIGQGSLPVKNIYQGDSCYHYFGDSQDAYLAFTGTHFYLYTDAGNIIMSPGASSKWVFAANGILYPQTTDSYNIGTTNSRVLNIYQGDNAYHYFGETQDAYIRFDGTSLIVSSSGVLSLRTTSANSLNFYTNNAICWYFSSGGDLLPSAAGVRDIGSTTLTLANIYQGDSCYHYFGDSLDANIVHTGTVLAISNITGEMQFKNNTTSSIRFVLNSASIWTFSNPGHFSPASANTYDLGTAANLIRHIYQGDSCIHYFGDAQDANIQFDGTNFYIGSTTDMYVGPTSLSVLRFRTNNTVRFSVTSTGHFMPFVTNTYDIGSASLQVRDIYLQNAPTVSDIRLKNSIEPSILGLDFINHLNPVSFKYNDTPNDRRRYGLIAQEVKEVLDAAGLDYDDFCGVRYHDKEDIWSLDYRHFIAPLIQAVKELNNKVDSLIN